MTDKTTETDPESERDEPTETNRTARRAGAGLRDDDDSLPLVAYDDAGNAHPSVVTVTLRARVAPTALGTPLGERPDVDALAEKVVRAYLHGDANVEFPDVGAGGPATIAFPDDAVVAAGDAQHAMDADDERTDD